MDFLKIDPSSLLQMDRLKRKFGELSVRLVDVGTEAAGRYLLAIFKKEIPPYRYVSRLQAYGKTFFSDRQRRAVMAMIRSGEIVIPYARRSPSGGLATEWYMVGSGHNLIIENRSPSARWVYSEEQARQINMVGWRKASTTLEEKERNATDAAARAIKKEIDKTMGSE